METTEEKDSVKLETIVPSSDSKSDFKDQQSKAAETKELVEEKDSSSEESADEQLDDDEDEEFGTKVFHFRSPSSIHVSCQSIIRHFRVCLFTVF
jgi:hypothetical protein